MFHHRPTAATRRTRRATLVASAATAILLPLGLAAPAVAAEAPHDQRPAAAVQQDVPTVVDEVAGFYGSYISAVGEGNNSEARTLRAETLNADFQERLAAWEAEHQADGVFRSQHVPTDVDVVYDGSGMGHSWTIVTLRWDDATAQPTQLHVQSDIDTQRISDIKPFEG